ncbi:hypothetical protein [Solicola sp. PLA-1-18]|uniref:hypothetical protein n=1 Tax=Solicola sp. PLA-1-18 TaxID=3380532 RepID=UPI003B7BECE3
MTTSGAAQAARTIGTLGLLTLALPANAVVTVASLLVTPLARRRPDVAARPRTVMVSGGKMTKALALARSFHAAGHRVVLVEKATYRLTGHRFSRAVDAFRTVPDPRDPGYAEALLAVVRAEGVDVYVPVCSPVASVFDARAAEVLAGHCEVLSCTPDEVALLDDKHRFAELAASLGLAVPDTHLVTSPEQVLDFDFTGRRRPYVLKSIAYDPVNRLDLTQLPLPTRAETEAFVAGKPISPDNPWILQEFVAGREYCTHTTARDGEVQVYCCCDSSAFQVNYAMVDDPEIEQWVATLVKGLGLSGQVSFDFMRADDDGVAYAIECNPRTHSAITMFYDHPGLADAYLETGGPRVLPTAASRPTYWLYHELWRALSRPSTALERLRVVLEGKDAVFALGDPLPFFVLHHVEIPALLLANLRRGGRWNRVDFNIGKLVEPAGD